MYVDEGKSNTRTRAGWGIGLLRMKNGHLGSMDARKDTWDYSRHDDVFATFIQ